MDFLGDLRGKKFQDSLVAKGFLVQPTKTGTVTWEQLVAMFFPLNELSLESLRHCFSITKTKQLIKKISRILWRSPLFKLLFLATRSTKHSPLLK